MVVRFFRVPRNIAFLTLTVPLREQVMCSRSCLSQTKLAKSRLAGNSIYKSAMVRLPPVGGSQGTPEWGTVYP